MRRNFNTKCLRSLDVDDEFECRRLLDWQFRWIGPLDDAVNKRCSAVQRVGYVWPVDHQPAGLSEFAPAVHRGRRCCTASSAIRPRLYNEKLCANVSSASAPPALALVKALSRSSPLLASTGCRATPSFRAAASVCASSPALGRSAGL